MTESTGQVNIRWAEYATCGFEEFRIKEISTSSWEVKTFDLGSNQLRAVVSGPSPGFSIGITNKKETSETVQEIFESEDYWLYSSHGLISNGKLTCEHASPFTVHSCIGVRVEKGKAVFECFGQKELIDCKLPANDVYAIIIYHKTCSVDKWIIPSASM